MLDMHTQTHHVPCNDNSNQKQNAQSHNILVLHEPETQMNSKIDIN